jgi:antitoxin HigA-1
MKQKRLAPVHPGEVLLEEFLRPLAISQYRLAKDIRVPPRRVNEIVLRKRSVSADTALRLGRFFGTSAELWLNLQSQYDLDLESDQLGGRLEAEVVPFAPRAVSAAHASPPRSRPNLKQGTSVVRKSK